MRIVYLSAARIPSREANSIQVMRMCDAFARNGHSVTLMAIRNGTRHASEVDGAYYGVQSSFELVKCGYPGVPRLGPIVHANRTSREVKSRRRPDIFYGRYLYNLISVASLRVPMILEVHDIPHTRRARSMMKRLFRCPHFVRLVAISESLCREYDRLFPEVGPDRMMVAHDGASILGETRRDAFPVQWPGRADVLQVGYTGHLYPGRGIEIILSLAAAMPDIDFHVVGGMEHDIRRWRAQSRLPNILFHGFVPPADVSSLARRFDIVVAPYQSRVAIIGGAGDTSAWMSPLKIFEYMALGKAIVCSDLPVLREVLTDNMTALLVPPADTDAWIQAVSRLGADAALRASLGNAARQVLASRYTWALRAETVLSGLS